jgi:hypothetical protein
MTKCVVMKMREFMVISCRTIPRPTQQISGWLSYKIYSAKWLITRGFCFVNLHIWICARSEIISKITCQYFTMSSVLCVLGIVLKCSGPVTFEVSTLLMLKIGVIWIVVSSGRVLKEHTAFRMLAINNPASKCNNPEDLRPVCNLLRSTG